MARDDFGSIWEDARKRYTELSGKDFRDIPLPLTSEDLIRKVEVQNGRHKHFREKQRFLFNVLSAAMTPIELVGNFAAGAASSAFPPSQMCFGAVMYLINAAKGVSATLDAITDLLSEVKNYTVRLNVYLRENLSNELREKLAEILVTVIDILGRSTKVIEDSVVGRINLFGRNIFSGTDQTMQGLIAKLKRLTDSEQLLVGAENLVMTVQTNRTAEAVQNSVTEQAARLRKMSIGMNQILGAVDEARAVVNVEKDVKHMEAVKNMLQPSFLAEDYFHGIKRDHVPNSGDWIRSEVQMQAWTDSKVPILWISGNPGSGKSFLAYNIVTHLQMTYQDAIVDESHVSVSYFFFRDNQDQTRLFEVALRNIAYQIAQTDHVYAKYIEGLWHRSPAIGSTRSAWKTLFVDFFLDQDTKGSSAYIILDGIDEAFQDDRNTFFDLLNDVQQLRTGSRLHVAMLGRPQIVEEMAEAVAGSIPTIHVDRVKTSGDIARYVELSISKSKVLSRVSDQLKQLIVRTLSTKAEGMFLWVKLMIAELGKKSRESAIRESLNKAPAGLTKMLRHVLETFSATLEEDDANDFNNMLAWVALAKRPLTLGELDAMLRLQSPEGDAVILLESKLRKQYASLFTLKRDDNLSTGDLLNQKPILDDGEDFQTDLNLDEGLDDVENETDFNSNPTSTTLSFSHSSISDFFHDPKGGKVTATGGDHPAVGIDLNQSRLSIANTCIKLVVDSNFGRPIDNTVGLRAYAAFYWKQHLDAIDHRLTAEERVNLGLHVADMMRNESLLPVWVGSQEYGFFGEETAKGILRRISDPDVLQRLPEDIKTWILSIQEIPIAVFEPAMRFISKAWLLGDEECDPQACVATVSSWLSHKNGTAVEIGSSSAELIKKDALWPMFESEKTWSTRIDGINYPSLSVDSIERAALWPAFDKTADWYRRVGLVLRQYEWYDDAMRYFETALAMRPGWWKVKAGISILHFNQGKYEEALTFDDEVLKLVGAENEGSFPDKDESLFIIHSRIGTSNINLAYRIKDESTGDERVRLLNKGLESFSQALHYKDDAYTCAGNRFFILNLLIKECAKGTSSELLSVKEYYDEVMASFHRLDAIEKDGTTALVRFFQEFYSSSDDALIKGGALAAVENQELAWLQAKYREAIAYADSVLNPVTSAGLCLCLAQLYSMYGNDEDKAAKIWEYIGTTQTTSNAVASAIGTIRSEALNQLGQYLIRKALEDESRAKKYVDKMERIVSRRRYGARVDTEDSVPPNHVALHLASWYHKLGRDGEAREAVKAHIQDAMIILSDDDPNNDDAGYWKLKQAFIAVGDDRNAFAVMHANRQFQHGLAVIRAPGDYGPDESDPHTGWSCDGICGRAWSYCDGMIECRYCNVEFCSSCHQLLLRGELPKKMCGKDHIFVTVPYLTPEQAFKAGEILVEGKAITTERWKSDVKKQYAL